MADLRISPGSQSLTTVQPTARTDAVKAAQRAFFNAALTQAQAQPEVKRTAATALAVEQPTVTRLHATTVESPSPTDRILRPGSLLDIKV